MQKIKTFKILWHYIKDDKLRLIAYIFLVAFSYFPSLFAAVLWGILIEALTKGDFENFVLLLAIYEGIYIFSFSILQIPRDYLYNELEIKFMKNVSKDLYTKMDSLPAIAFEEMGVENSLIVYIPIQIVSLNYFLKWFDLFVVRLSCLLF